MLVYHRELTAICHGLHVPGRLAVIWAISIHEPYDRDISGVDDAWIAKQGLYSQSFNSLSISPTGWRIFLNQFINKSSTHTGYPQTGYI